MTAGGSARAVTVEARAAIGQAFGCDGAVLVAVASQAHEAALPRGAVLWPLPGRDETTLILTGRANEVAYGRDGGVLLLQLLAPGDLYGSLVGSGDGVAQIEAVEEGRGAHFTTASLVRLMETYGCVALAVSRQLATRLEALRRRMVETNLLSVTGRICAELLRRSAVSGDRTIRPLPVMAELAVSVQSTRETVSRTVSQLEKRGILKRVDGGLAIVAPHRLEEQIY